MQLDSRTVRLMYKTHLHICMMQNSTPNSRKYRLAKRFVRNVKSVIFAHYKDDVIHVTYYDHSNIHLFLLQYFVVFIQQCCTNDCKPVKVNFITEYFANCAITRRLYDSRYSYRFLDKLYSCLLPF